MGWRLHRGGRTRAWLGRRFGGDAELGDRIWRRVLHLAGAAVLLVYLLPRNIFLVAPTDEVLLLALAMVLVLEIGRRVAHLELPTIRPHESDRMASYAYFAIALTASVELFPEYLALAVVLGAVVLDPLLGELRLRGWTRYPAASVGVLLYVVLGLPGFWKFGPWGAILPIPMLVAAGAIAVLVEGPRSLLPLDDDAAMVLVPGLVLAVLGWLTFGPTPIPAF
jgi:hypothetical protein